jgi:hypothetical protein
LLQGIEESSTPSDCEDEEEGLLDQSKPMIFEGRVKTYAKQTFILDDNDESIYGWIHKHTKELEGKRVRIVLEKKEEEDGP